jgi:hypothetical protein
MDIGHLLWMADPVGLHDAAIARTAGLQGRLRATTLVQRVAAVLRPRDVEHRDAATHAELVPVPASVLDTLAELTKCLDQPDRRGTRRALTVGKSVSRSGGRTQ